MKTWVIKKLTMLAALSALGGALPAAAHHSYAMFDMERDVLFKGTVVDYQWRAPHMHIIVNVPPAEGVDPETVGTWDVEGASPSIMTRQGWNRATYKEGDEITFVGRPMRDGSKGVALFYAIQPDGQRLYMDIARPDDQ